MGFTSLVDPIFKDTEHLHLLLFAAEVAVALIKPQLLCPQDALSINGVSAWKLCGGLGNLFCTPNGFFEST